ncbi:MAG TPA: HD domain-containing protein [Deltaproteobacteria bacterium]|nr:HD domain-containing protein [Deltaproteobacteria bacterium]HQB37890.1 HD domain-containing protein [Deltaproteobacteria bacterium]
MEQLRLDDLYGWFEAYAGSYLETDSEAQANIRLKIEHTRQVCRVMGQLADGEQLEPQQARIAAAVALLHDVGRFPQYRRWRTFRDRDSDNHGRLAVEVIREQQLLRGLPAEETLVIEEAVRFHNLLELPRKLRSPTDMYLRLVRDADKLDIWRVFVEQFRVPAAERASAAFLGFPDGMAVTPVCLQALAERRVVRLETVKSVNDFRLLLISWVFSLNYPASRRILWHNGYVGQLAADVADDAPERGAIDSALAFLADQAGSKDIHP